MAQLCYVMAQLCYGSDCYGSVSVGSLGPGAHKVCLSPLSVSGKYGV